MDKGESSLLVGVCAVSLLVAATMQGDIMGVVTIVGVVDMGHSMDDGVMVPLAPSLVPPSASASAGCGSGIGPALYVDYGSSRGGDVDMEVDREMNWLLPFRKSVHLRAGAERHGTAAGRGQGVGLRGEGVAEDP
jgi:hypothetical protein